MHKSASQGLKRTFMHVSGLPQPYFDLKNKTIYKLIGFLSKNVGGRNARFFCFFLSQNGGGRPET